jgi:transaldolase
MTLASAPLPSAATAALDPGGHWLAGLAPAQLAQLPALAAHLPLHGAVAGAGLACAHAQRACDILAFTYEATDGRSGFVAVAPACGPGASRAELLDAARRMWWAVHRPNALIALPATADGIGVMEDAICDGIGVYAGLVFTPAQLQAVRKAQRRGLARRLERRHSIQRIGVVAAVDVASIDAAVNALLPPAAADLLDQAGAASMQLAAADAHGSGFSVFAAFGALPLQLLQVAEAGTIAALPDRGPATDDSPVMTARAALARLARHGIDLETIGNGLLDAALRQFGPKTPSKLLALPGWPGTIAEFQEPLT